MTVVARRNECAHPQSAMFPAGWVVSGSSVTQTTITGVSNTWDSAPSHLVTAWSLPGSAAAGACSYATSMLLVVGGTYYATVWVRHLGPTAHAYTLAASGGSSVTVTLSAAGGPLGNGWTPIVLSFVASVASTTITISNADTTASAGVTVQVGPLLVEAGRQSGVFDGSMPGAVWAGRPWASKSTWTYTSDGTSSAGFSGPYPYVVVLFDARPPASWEVTLDGTAATGLDSAAVLTDSPRWTPIGNVRSINIDRGHQSVDQQIQSGTAIIQVDNWDGALDADYAGSPYQSSPGTSYLTAGMSVRVVAVLPQVNGAPAYVQAPRFTGELADDGLVVGWDRMATITAVDPLTPLGTTQLASYPTPVHGGETTARRGAWIAAQCGVPFSASPNAVTHLLPTSGGSSARTEMDGCGASEAGRVYADVWGTVKLTTRGDEFTAPALVLTDTGNGSTTSMEYESLTLAPGTAFIVNQATVDRGSAAVPQMVTAANLQSIDQYSQRSLASPVYAPILDVTQAHALATYLASRRALPAPLVQSVDLDLSGQTAAALPLLLLDLGSRVSIAHLVKYSSGNRQVLVTESLEGVREVITADTWTSTLFFGALDVYSFGAGVGPFVLDHSSLDGPDYLTPY